MRVVAGSLGGRIIHSPGSRDGGLTRPTTDKVRAAIFNSVESHIDMDGLSVVDLFAGTGACGIEAISRGAGSAVFVEQSKVNAQLIRKNLDTLELNSQARVEVQDALKFLIADHHFDLAIVDPPYVFDGWSTLLERLRANLVVCESDRRVEVDEESRWVPVRYKNYGGTHVTIVEKGDV